jgi:hypothetical protein
VASAAQALLRELRGSGASPLAEAAMMQFDDFNRLVGLPEIRTRENRLCSDNRHS